MFALWDRFDSNHPQTEPHAYLSLLATHPDHRGHGIAQALLRDNLAAFDPEGCRHTWSRRTRQTITATSGLGFAKIGEFAGSVAGRMVSTMWRPAGGG